MSVAPRSRAIRRAISFPIVSIPVVDDHLTAVAASRLHLGDRRILRHHDDGLDVEQSRSERHRLRMVSRRKCNDATRALVPGQARQCVEGTAKFESAHALKVFALEKHFRARLLVGEARRQHRRAVCVTREAATRGLHVRVGRQAVRHIADGERASQAATHRIATDGRAI